MLAFAHSMLTFHLLTSPTEGTILCEHKCGWNRGGGAGWWTKVPFSSSSSFQPFSGTASSPPPLLATWRANGWMLSRTSRGSRRQGKISCPLKALLLAGSLGLVQQHLSVPRLFWRTRTSSRSTPTRRSPPATSVHKCWYSLSVDFSSLLATDCEGTLARGSSASSVGRALHVSIQLNIFVAGWMSTRIARKRCQNHLEIVWFCQMQLVLITTGGEMPAEV